MFGLGNAATDPVCLMRVSKKEGTLIVEYKGKTYYFCSQNCKNEFQANPEKYAE